VGCITAKVSTGAASLLVNDDVGAVRTGFRGVGGLASISTVN